MTNQVGIKAQTGRLCTALIALQDVRQTARLLSGAGLDRDCYRNDASMSTASIFINGKFCAQRTTGVQRVARSLVAALDDQLAEAARPWVMLRPPGAEPLELRHIDQVTIGWPRLPLHLWEQIVLPTAARSGLLINLAGSAPFFGARQMATLHDAAAFDHPDAYTVAFGVWYRMLFHRLARRAEGVFTVSAFSRDRLLSCLPALDEDRLVVLPSAADHLAHVVPDPEVLDRHGLRGRRLLLAVGSSNPTKNLPRLIAAFESLEGPELRLVIVGGRNDRVFSGGDACPADLRIVRTGPLEDASLVALYRYAAALVFPSIYEGFGLPPLEAMSMGCPVVAARAASLPEVLGDAALYFDPTSVDELAAALRRVLGDDTLRQRLVAAGRARAGERRWAFAAAMLRQVIEKRP